MVEITCAPGVPTTEEEVRSSHLFQQWLERRHGRGITVHSVHVLAAHKRGKPVPLLKMMYIVADATETATGRTLDGQALLRGAIVDMLALVYVEGDPETYVALVQQPRLAGMQTHVTSNPAGMVDANEGVKTAGLRELDEELDERDLVWSEPINIGERVTGSPDPFLVTPGGSDETSQFLQTSTRITREEYDRINNKMGGVADEGEQTRIRLVPLKQAISALRRGGLVDLKTLASLLLYKESLISGNN